MRILLLSSAPAASGKRIGGTIVWSQIFVRMMRKMGHQVYIVTYGNECALLDCAEFSKDLFFVAYESSLSIIDSILFNTVPRMMLNAVKKSVKIVKEKNINIIFTSSIHEAAGFYLFNPGVPVYSFCHAYYPYELDLWFKGKYRYPRLVEYWILERLAKMVIRGVLYPSIWLKDKLVKRLGGISGYVMGYANPEQPDEGIPSSRESFGMNDDKPVVMSYNPMIAPHNKKSFELYLRSVKKITEKRAAQYVLFGVKKEAVDFVTKAINGLPIKIITPVENIFKVLSLADIYFHVSLIDTFSFITIEAMSLGLPVVASNRGALPERIEHNKTGILVEAEPESIAKAMVTMLDDQRLQDRLGKAAKEYIAKGDYSEATVGKVLADFLDSKSKY